MTSAAGFGLATIADDGTVLDAWFPDPELGAYSPSGTTRLSADDVPDEFAALAGPDPDRGVEVVAIRTVTRRWPTSRPTPTTPTCGCT